ncbi:MAG TPA: SBBP repeat-containing protein, partial [Terriglobales bacterium]|nr:SBBP repeat-containing protein [Terriglobales bacterium]
MRLNRGWLGITCSRGGPIGAILLLIMLGVIGLRFAPSSSRFSPDTRRQGSTFPPNPAISQPVLKTYSQLPLVFEANQGQSDPRVKFLAHGSAYGLFLTADSAVLRLQHSDKQVSVLSMVLVGASPKAEPEGTDELPGKSNYFIGNDPAKWHRDVPQFGRVRYANIYPGVDLVFYGKQRRLEYDFEVLPGGDPHQVALKFEGTQAMSIDPRGDLVLQIPGGDVRLQALRIYQKVGETEQPVQGRFEPRGKNEVGFALQAYDRSRTLVIDPILTYSTYLGGSADEACSVILGTGTPLSGCPAVAVDSASNAYIAGSTTSTNFPTVSPFQATKNGTANVFVSKFNAAANTLVFSTYLGGNGTDYTAGVAVDQGFDVLVAGTTSSTNFPTNGKNKAFQTTPASTNDHVFVSELGPTGQTLNYSTYLSGNGVDKASGLAIDSEGNAYVTGTTTSTNTPPSASFPATLGAIQTSSRAPSQFFLTKVSPSLSGSSSLAYSTYFGGSTP